MIFAFILRLVIRMRLAEERHQTGPATVVRVAQDQDTYSQIKLTAAVAYGVNCAIAVSIRS
jgi:hypothetical protein